MNKKLFQELRVDDDNEEEDLARSDSENEKYEIKNTLQFVQEQSVNFHSKSNFFKLNSD